MSERTEHDVVTATIKFPTQIGGNQVWTGGEFTAVVMPDESVDDAISRAEVNALDVAFDMRDAYIRRMTNKRANKTSAFKNKETDQ